MITYSFLQQKYIFIAVFYAFNMLILNLSKGTATFDKPDDVKIYDLVLCQEKDLN